MHLSKLGSVKTLILLALFSSASYAADGGPSNTTTQMSPTEAQLSRHLRLRCARHGISQEWQRRIDGFCNQRLGSAQRN
jgi:hypothetical protein